MFWPKRGGRGQLFPKVNSYWPEQKVEKGEKVIIMARGGGQLKVRAGPK